MTNVLRRAARCREISERAAHRGTAASSNCVSNCSAYELVRREARRGLRENLTVYDAWYVALGAKRRAIPRGAIAGIGRRLAGTVVPQVTSPPRQHRERRTREMLRLRSGIDLTCLELRLERGQALAPEQLLALGLARRRRAERAGPRRCSSPDPWRRTSPSAGCHHPPSRSGPISAASRCVRAVPVRQPLPALRLVDERVEQPLGRHLTVFDAVIGTRRCAVRQHACPSALVADGDGLRLPHQRARSRADRQPSARSPGGNARPRRTRRAGRTTLPSRARCAAGSSRPK